MSAQLQPEVLDRLAQRIADLLEPRLVEALGDRAQASGEEEPLADASKTARVLGVSRQWVYEHQEELGAVHLGDGERPRLRFDLERAKAARKARAEPAPGVDLARRRYQSPDTKVTQTRLLPIKGCDQ